MQVAAVGFDQNRAVRRRVSSDDNRNAARESQYRIDLQLLDKNHRDTADAEQHGGDFDARDALVRQMNPR